MVIEVKKKNKKLKKIFIIVGSIFLVLVISFLFLLYGPYSGFRDFLITSSMTTKSHQYIAKFFYSDKTIDKVLKKNGIIESDKSTDTKLINIKKKKGSKTYKNEYEKQILDRSKDESLYKVINVSGKTYQGYLVAIYDPSRVGIATTRYLGVRGEAIDNVAKRYGAVVAMNAGGFYDPDWNSNGDLRHGIVIENGKVVSEYAKANVGGGMVGFTNDNKLVLGKFSKSEALNMGIRDAVEFGPFLIINGEASKVLGNGGWGIAPRTAIGQRQDGIVLFLVINGRIPTSIGADMNDLIDIMQRYGAYNAANMDGGSSTELVINNKIINKPVAGGRDGLRDMPTFWIVK